MSTQTPETPETSGGTAAELSPSAVAIRDAYAFAGGRIHLGAMIEGRPRTPLWQ